MPLNLLFYSLLGLIIGSFLNVCIYRIPRRESIVFPGSHCPRCGSGIRFYDNVPILSYFLLGGKCRACGNPISMQYPLVELLSGLAFCACGLEWNFAPPTYVNSLFLSAIILLAFIDYHHRILPNVLTLPGVAAGILLSFFQSPSLHEDALSLGAASLLWPKNPQAILPLTGSVLGALIGGGILFCLGQAYQWIRKKQGLGMGDVKMMAMVGAFLGWHLAILTIFAGSFLGSFVGIFLMLIGKASFQSKLPLGTFLGIASALALFYGLPSIRWYLHIPQ